MEFSDKLVKDAIVAVSEEMNAIKRNRRIPKKYAPGVGEAWINLNAIAAGFLGDDALVIAKLKQLKGVWYKHPRLEKFWKDNARELEAILMAETIDV